MRAALKRNGDNLSLAFPFAAPTPAAVFRRADTVWLVFDTDAAIASRRLKAEQGKAIKSATATRVRDVAMVRIKLDRPQLVSVAADGNGWVVTLGNEVVEPTRPLAISRNIVASTRSSITIPIDDPRSLHRIDDPDAGDTLYVVTALAPARGFLKAQDFVEFRVLASTHGVVLQPLADDLNAELAADKVIVSRPSGLTLSAVDAKPNAHDAATSATCSTRSPGASTARPTSPSATSQLILAAADAPEPKRLAARCDLARFYLARDMFPRRRRCSTSRSPTIRRPPRTPRRSVLRAIANIMIGRPDAALKDLSNPFVGNQHDAPLWRALAYARLGKWAEAREGFRNAEAAMTTLPLEMQRTMLKDMVRASLEVGDVTGAAGQLNEFEMIGVPRELEPAIAVLTGRLAEGLGRTEDALRAYRAAANSWDRPAAAQGRLREILLAVRARQSRARRRHRRARDADHDLARRRDRGRGAAAAGAALYRGGPLPRRIPGHAHGAAGAPEFGHDAPHPGRGGDDLRQPVPGRQGRRAAGDRRARLVLRFPRADADRPARRRDDPAARRPAGLGRSALSRPASCCSTRSTTACRAPRARRSRRGWR